MMVIPAPSNVCVWELHLANERSFTLPPFLSRTSQGRPKYKLVPMTRGAAARFKSEASDISFASGKKREIKERNPF